ncbi:MAG: 8-amino-7-oxononanoate synthase [Flavobacteriaceae bacterium]
MERERAGTLRSLPMASGLVDFSSNDYLGFSREETISDAAVQLLKEQNLVLNGATGSRLLCGNHPIYGLLENKLTRIHQVDAALVFNSGYDANVGFFASVPQRGDMVFYDEYIHASIRDGIQMGHANGFKFEHNNLGDLSTRIMSLANGSEAAVYVVTESIFSMDGDSPNLPQFSAFCKANGYYLVVDEAHALGIFGNDGAGIVQHLGLQQDIFARIVTFGKAMGCHGAAILGSRDLKTYLLNFARSFIYTTGLPPHTVATIDASYEMAKSDLGKRKRQQLNENIAYFNQELGSLGLGPKFIPSNSAIHCCIIPGNEQVSAVANAIRKFGFEVKPILNPTVPIGQERLRICLHAYNSKEQIGALLYRLSVLIKNS